MSHKGERVYNMLRADDGFLFFLIILGPLTDKA